MAGKGEDVVDALRRAQPRGGAAHPLVERDADERRLALKRPEHQFSAVEAVKARPVQIGDRLPEQRRDIRHIGDAVALLGRAQVWNTVTNAQLVCRSTPEKKKKQTKS